jgi:hypothetical protein
MYPRTRTDRTDLIDAAVGAGSPFQRSFGAVLPRAGAAG